MGTGGKLRALGCAAGAAAALSLAPSAQAQIDGLSVTPATTCVFVGPEGGPFAPTSCDYTLNNANATPFTVSASVFVNWNPPWLEALVDGAPAPSGAFDVVVPAGGSVPFTLRLTAAVAGVTDPNNEGRIGGINFANPAIPQQQVGASGRLEFVAGNDAFAAAKLIDPVVMSAAGSTVGATKETGEPNHAGNAGGASLWFRYDAPNGASGTVSVNTNFSSFDTLLAVYTGTSLGGLTPIAANDDASGGVTTSALSFAIAPGATYYFALDGKVKNAAPAETGFFNIAFTQNLTLLNDAFAAAVPISGASGATSQFASNFVAPSRETGEPAHGGGFGGSTWFSWQAPSTGVFRLAAGAPTPGGFPVIAVYLGDAVDNLTEIASTTILAGATNTLDFTAVAGAQYKIALAGGGLASSYPLTWAPADPQPPIGVFASILPTSRAVGVGQTAGVFANMLNATGETAVNCRPEPPNALSDVTPNGFIFQTTGADNTLTGAPDTPFDIPPGGVQNMILNLTRDLVIASGRQGFRFVCDNLAAAPIYPEVNTWILRVLAPDPADVVAIGATITTPGVVELPLGGASAFSAAGVNIGPDAAVTVRPSASFAGGVGLTVCETDAQGQCLAPAAASLVIPVFEELEIRTFSVFVSSTGAPIDFDPGFKRLRLDFLQGATLVGATSVAVRTQ